MTPMPLSKRSAPSNIVAMKMFPLLIGFDFNDLQKAFYRAVLDIGGSVRFINGIE
jgi:hypothetical protein